MNDETKSLDAAFLTKLRILGVVEAFSTLLLFGVAMPLKYMAGIPLAVTIMGSLHGVLFMALVALNAIALDRIPIGTKTAVAGVVGAVIPFGPFVVDHVYLKPLAQSA